MPNLPQTVEHTQHVVLQAIPSHLAAEGKPAKSIFLVQGTGGSPEGHRSHQCPSCVSHFMLL